MANNVNQSYKARMQGKGPNSVSVRTRVDPKSTSSNDGGPIHDAFESTRRGLNNTIQMVSSTH